MCGILLGNDFCNHAYYKRKRSPQFHSKSEHLSMHTTIESYITCYTLFPTDGDLKSNLKRVLKVDAEDRTWDQRHGKKRIGFM